MEAMYIVVVALLTITEVSTDSADCFRFDGEGKIVFSYNKDIASEAHFSLKFKTRATSGVMLYAGGTYNPQRVFDYEGMYIDDGFLHYFLYNPGVYSTGSSSGFFGRSKVNVSDGVWHKAEFTRNRKVETIHENGSRTTEFQTGLILDGMVQAMDHREKTGVDIFQPITLGLDPHKDDRRNPLPGFVGSIMDFKDVMRDSYLVDGTGNGHVQHCFDIPPAQ